jgi:hypothetical protein
MKDHLLRNEPSTPFSGAAQGNNKQQNQQNRRKKGAKGNKTQQNPQRFPRWTPHGPALLAATAAATMTNPADYTPYLAEIQRLQRALSAHTGSYQPTADFSMPVALQATYMPADRPREFYCWLHGWNNLQNHGGEHRVYTDHEKRYRTKQHRRQPESGRTGTSTPYSSSTSSSIFLSSSSLCVLSAIITTISPTNNTHPQPGFVKR